MTTTERLLPVEAEPYLAAVRSLLWALPAAEREELLDDLSAHLAELAAEEGPPLRERLGVPSAYAAEFLASAGVEPPATKEPISLSKVRALRVPPALRERLAALRPAWLVLRPFALVFGGAELFIGDFIRNIERHELVLLGLASVAAISLSQRLTGAWDRFATIAAVVCGVALAVASTEGPRIVYVDSTGVMPSGYLTRADGTPISNIWAYDRDGNPIDAFLFDQDGQPIVDLTESGWDQRTGEEVRTSMRTDADGRVVPNLFPREQSRISYDEYGRPVERESSPPRFATPELADDEPTTTTTAPSTTSTTAAPVTTTATAAP